jgi:hypothetical protein
MLAFVVQGSTSGRKEGTVPFTWAQHLGGWVRRKEEGKKQRSEKNFLLYMILRTLIKICALEIKDGFITLL